MLGDRNVIWIAFHRVVVKARAALACADAWVKAGDTGMIAYRDQCLERLHHLGELSSAMQRTHWKTLYRTGEFDDMIEDLINEITPRDEFQNQLHKKQAAREQINEVTGEETSDEDFEAESRLDGLDSWDIERWEFNALVERIRKQILNFLRALERKTWELVPEALPVFRPLEYRPKIQPNAPALI
jgi:hypothetical protein